MKVICDRCHSQPCERRDFVTLEHKEIFCLTNMKNMVKGRDKKIKCLMEEVKNYERLARPHHLYSVLSDNLLRRFGIRQEGNSELITLL